MRRFAFVFLFMFVLGTGMLLAQEVAPVVEIDLSAEIEVAMGIFFTGIGGMGVTALTSVFKRFLKAQGGWVILISVGVSAVAVLLYLFPLGLFVWWKALLLWVIVSLAANGIYLTPQKRT